LSNSTIGLIKVTSNFNHHERKTLSDLTEDKPAATGHYFVKPHIAGALKNILKSYGEFGTRQAGRWPKKSLTDSQIENTKAKKSYTIPIILKQLLLALFEISKFLSSNIY